MASDYEHLFAEQGRRWQQADLNPAQRSAVDAYVALVDVHLQALAAILDLACEIRHWTIEEILAKTELDLGIEILTNRYGRPN